MQTKYTKFKKQPNKNNIISMMTFCQKCKCQVTRKNKVVENYVCDKCIKLELSTEDQTQRYVDWNCDLDYLYYHVWLEL